ncbi:MAG: hypothetical protein J1E85_05300 [Ruminococcus sp.]|nr:hypothetical protein [Ruminococcus sp.]
MVINIGNHEFTEVWDGVLYKKLSDYPNISDWEIKNIIDFVNYENLYNRKTKIVSENDDILCTVNNALTHPEKFYNINRPDKITECTACPVRKGCMTDFVCHTSPVENALKIFESGKLLSAVNARNLPAEVLMKESRNAANDPADYFNYVMLSWGNCQAGDRLVMERKLKRFPNEQDLSVDFTPGVRFYFRFDDLAKNPDTIFDGVLPMKVKDKIVLNDYVYAIIIPLQYIELFKDKIPRNLLNRTHFIENNCKDIWDWSEKVYSFVENLN